MFKISFLHEGDLTESEINGKDREDMFEVIWAKIEVAYNRQKINLATVCRSLNV